jgi:hypothetical protein
MNTNPQSPKLSQGETSLRILTPPLRLTLLTALGLSVIGVTWSFVARVPMQTRGTAILIPASGVSGIYAQTSGTLLISDPRKEQPEWVASARGFLSNPLNNSDDSTLLSLAGRISSEKTDDTLLLDPGVVNNVDVAWMISKGFLIARINDPELIAKVKQNYQNYLSARTSNEQMIQQQVNQIRIYKSELDAQTEFLNGMMSLRAKQYVSQSSVLQQQATIANLKNQINTVRSQILQTRQDTNNKRSLLVSALTEYISDAMYFSPIDGSLDAVLSQTFNFIQTGSQIAIVSRSSIRKPTTIPVVFSNKDAATVRKGQKVYLQLLSLNSANDNSRLVGTIDMMDSFPSDSDSLKNIVGSKGLSNLLTSQYVSPTAGVIKLDRDEKGEYVYTIPQNTTEKKRYYSLRIRSKLL